MTDRPRATWTDERLDDLAAATTRMDARLTGSIEKLELSVDRRFEKFELSVVHGTMHEIQRSIVGLQRTAIAALIVIAGIAGAGHL